MPSAPGWKPFALLTSKDKTVITQVVKADPKPDGKWPDLYGWQEKPNRTAVVCRYVHGITGYRAAERMWLLRGGHGFPFQVQHDGGIWLRFRHPSVGWVRIPFQAGQTWGASDVVKHQAGPLAGTAPPNLTWDQGQTVHDGTWYRLCGVPFKPDGPSKSPAGVRHPNIPARIKIIRGGQIKGRIDISHLGRVGMVRSGRPMYGRLEPEGIGVIHLPVGPHLLVGFAVGPVGGPQRHMLYTRGLEK